MAMTGTYPIDMTATTFLLVGALAGTLLNDDGDCTALADMLRRTPWSERRRASRALMAAFYDMEDAHTDPSPPPRMIGDGRP